MGLSPDSLAKLTVAITISYRIQYMGLAFFSIYYYHYFETLVEEISSIWSQKWRTGKILYLVARYLPIVLIVLELLCGYSVNLILSPKVCGRLWTTVQVARWATTAASEGTAILVVAVFTVRYRNQACSLLKIIRRDSGVYIFSLTAINLGNTISSAYRLSHGVQYVPAA
ncbi:hypothetical protein DFP72DRAFT_1077743 [Ephemerocybe angulata]|uniref:DUF6533 domain-containing protein n=1 Tax=Ephemerocybe angulata TaxID=980116 RepID=A0A8H6LWD4_9AGAR|nr:hypothetical protein DFP72DRAFT_1077743 [Tulosesus angulatus]